MLGSSRLLLKPRADRRSVEMDEQPLPELLYGRQPFRSEAERSTVNREPDILDLAIGGGRGGLEAREALEAGNLAQTVHDHEISDGSQSRVRVRVPCRARKRLGEQQGPGLVLADGCIAARKDIEFRQLRRQ